MQFSILGACTFLLPLVQNAVLAQYTTTTTEENLSCVTINADTPAYEVETSTTTKSCQGTAGLTITVTPTVTITSVTETATTTLTSTVVSTFTDGQSGETFTTTITATNTITESSTELGTSTIIFVTTTTLTGLTTVPTASGFVPIRTSLPGSTNEQVQPNSPRRLSRRGKQCKPKSSNYPVPTAPTSYDVPSFEDSGLDYLPHDSFEHGYPSKVVCTTTVGTVPTTTVTSTAEPTTTTISASTLTVTSTETITLTSTVAGEGATTTITTSTSVATTTTIITTSQITTTATATQTVSAPSQTVYAACQGDANYAGYYNGYAHDRLGANGFNPVQGAGDTANACCNSCMADPNCVAFSFRGGNLCGHVVPQNGVCTAPNQYNFAFVFNRALTSPLGVVGNGNCGVINYALDLAPAA